ncbi:MAG: DEAD/DEAH box helicase [Actinobacteria bacterium]|nr:DEAD/DEAH box helicase [Actinomycetota bacterium]
MSADAAAIRSAFESGLGFDLDAFQVRAFDALDEGHSVLVAAPTGSGKTVVAEYAVDRALHEGGKAFYTTPLKALSNQKYGDLVRRYGPERVGLLTGDNAINGDAPIVVMTTEVLRNMIYAGSSALRGLRYVVLDEVHYLQNPYRGAVWEEVIIHAPPEIDLVCLSATVSNAEEFAEWIQTVRGTTTAVIEERRPIELENLYIVGDRGTEKVHLLPTFVDGRPNPEASNLDDRSFVGAAGRGRARRRLFTPRRTEVVEDLRDRSMLPAIYFIFSRAGCDEAVARCLQEGVRLTTPEERTEIRAIVEAKVESMSDGDLALLDYGPWLAGLEAGLAAHHAGLVPPFKEAVEACFERALVKVVFATETLSLGINMPARTVVIEKLTKFTGERHEHLTPGEYTQLTGRAGRRGIDDRGYAVVLWSPWVRFDEVAGLASRRAGALTSSFRPTYNMAANLVRRYAPDVAHHLLNLSFAQYRADSDIVRLEAQLARMEETEAEARQAAQCELGDVAEYRALVARAEASRPTRASDRADVLEALRRVRPGDVLVVPGGKTRGRVVVLATPQRRGGDTRLRVMTLDRRMMLLSARDFPAPPRAVGKVELPVPYAPNNHAFQRTVAERLTRTRLREDGVVGVEGTNGRRRRRGEESMAAATEAASLPVASCPDINRHIRAADRADRFRREVERLEKRIRSRTESLARQFDRVLRVLENFGYVEGWSLTDSGESLTRLYHESDLLVAEAMGAGLLDGLDAPGMAAVASMFSYEMRGPGAPPTPAFPSPDLRRRWQEVEKLGAELNQAEEEAGLPLTRPPDPGFAALAHGWARGEELHRIMDEDEMSGGDFVRNVKQLIDLLRQIGDAAPEAETRAAAHAAADALFRGVVAASSVVAA